MPYFNIIPLLLNEKGASAVEYSLIVAAIAAMIAVSLFTMGDQLQAVLQVVLDAITDANAEIS